MEKEATSAIINKSSIVYSTRIDLELRDRLKNIYPLKKGYLCWKLNSNHIYECDDFEYELIYALAKVIELPKEEWVCLINGAKFGNPCTIQRGGINVSNFKNK